MATQYPTEHENLQNEIERLKKRNEELVRDVMLQSAKASEAEETLRRWRVELEVFANQRGHNMCWMNDVHLLQNTIGYEHPKNGQIPPVDEFLLGCKIYCEDYYKSRFKRVNPRTDEPQT